MRTGLMRRVVTLRTSTGVPDGMGGFSSETTSDVENIPARVEPLEGRELLMAQQTGMDRPHRFTMRYRSGMTGAKVLIYDGRTFDIKSVMDPEERHRELIITANEVNA